MELFDDEPDTPRGNSPEFSVSEISGAIKRTIEGEFAHVRVRGEVGRVFKARTGHLYFDLKDDRNVLASVSWKGQAARLTHLPEEGMEVIATGKLTTFGPQSKYQLNVEDLQPAGAGALMAMLEKRRKALAAEGLFADERKRPLPYLPEVIGVVTSPSGAVIRDILHRLRDRFPRKVLVWPVAVQGQACAGDVARAIRGFNALQPGGVLPRPDLIIVARGGGSIEDLWGFNEEIVVRAAAESQIPLISAVGHETDTTLIDYASDRRAPTPTAAAELAVPVRSELLAGLDGLTARMSRGLELGLRGRNQRLADLGRALPRPESLLSSARQRFDLAAERLNGALRQAVSKKAVRLADLGLRTGPLRQALARDRDRLADRASRLGPALERQTRDGRQRVDRAVERLEPAMLRRLEQARDTERRVSARLLPVLVEDRIARARDRVLGLDRLRETLGYEATLARGFAVVRAEGRIVTGKAEAEGASLLEVQFRDGRLDVAPGGARPQASRKPKEPPPEQGTLL
ncbi:exodeoxyribonuclease VII large subunit [Ponticoccus sp. SC2-23]|uniref:exodeoxyribonuclease VII large subunit n=1 Tax=Alexandriicola marinus TaxID=2081710 RepID=UPI000FD959F8|nr:exodeoxyribonuclease VII large subunit [Alexandriicola marinus]MBM1221062.1 exodeoxyribonuclease VII large subunit [Ponticoccus sp. SC6-9]MBM1225632.1 exodeoxyribonuclease VII large subunit [Ponticoccus sp. SC6-15]MBM1227784.1 exodeoxyribonuclease VII large subunit [Ponticoccus sp. SC6-38]MBM1234578.1 exodeoxyribonuclease VII large subunit [Ponticoccus sp. SC6-45]MBM1238286.1 exodeoxyribonuclease VII large subunit [Ponticoccus sp. SC6-49]MBM1243555.1 exodeoxyribonuclease VII large subunit 